VTNNGTDESSSLVNKDSEDSREDADPRVSDEPLISPQQQQPEPSTWRTNNVKTRHASDIIVDLLTRSWIEGGSIPAESMELRNLISRRTEEYLNDLTMAIEESDDKLPHPKKLLHFLAPKIPAIKHSPDVALRIQSARSDMDSGVAACLVGTIGHVCELYEKKCDRVVTDDIVSDRRFEQLVECILCGVDMKKRRKEWSKLQQQQENDGSVSLVEDIEEILQEAHFAEGLSIRDSCRAAWGISILGANKLESLGGQSVSDILMALALRLRGLLLVRLQKLRQSDLYIVSDGESSNVNIDDRLVDFSEELAEDAASSMWTFACVRALTGMRFNPLFDVCFSILCADPFDLRRRAQEQEADVDATSVGSNDIVDRLAMSEIMTSGAEDAADAKITATSVGADRGSGLHQNLIEGRTTLIDYLSPKETADIAWALAVHGVTRNGTAAAIGTQETFRDVVFDRTLQWIREDLQSSACLTICEEAVASSEVEGVTSSLNPNLALSPVKHVELHNNIQATNDGAEEVQVVDAAALLASEAGSPGVETAEPTTDFPPSLHSAEIPQSGYVQVVDAAALLKSESNDFLVSENDESSSLLAGAEGEVDDNSVEDHAAAKEEIQPLFRFFTPHDLCSVAWAVTELEDPLQSSVVGTVARLFVQAGPRSLSGLSGGDLSNLAWAVAKNPTQTDDSTGSELAVLLVGWITDEILQSSEESEMVLQRFHPPEFSRLLWAVAEVYTTRLGGTRMAGSDASELVSVGLVTAAGNLDFFETEDMARIIWAFLALSDGFDYTKNRSTNESLALGKLLASIETCLCNWENCKPSHRKESGLDSSGSTREANRFASFFGRSRRHIPFLDQQIEDADELSLPLQTEQSSLPLLRDLPIDPLTLCKIACRFERIAENRERAQSSETLTRIALRLLTSRSGRLMKECPLNDLVRICEAAARTDSPSMREKVSHFARRLVLHLNGPGNEALATLSPGHHATLLWALGELGVKYAPSNIEDAASAHRRLHLVSVVPFLDKEQLVVLSHTRAAKMVCASST